jgi:4-carboxymuconolactone decarboxylase
MNAAQRAVHDAVISGARGKIVGPLRAALHNPELADKWQQLGALLRYQTSLPPVLSELAILVTARHWDSQFEWFQHAPIAAGAGVGDEVIDAIARGAALPPLPPDRAAVHAYAAELLARHRVGQVVYDRALAVLGTAGLVELTALIGYYSMVALTLNAHEFDLPPGITPPLPLLRPAEVQT